MVSVGSLRLTHPPFGLDFVFVSCIYAMRHALCLPAGRQALCDFPAKKKALNGHRDLQDLGEKEEVSLMGACLLVIPYALRDDFESFPSNSFTFAAS